MPSAERVTARNILHHPAAHPVALSAYMLRHYGPEWVTWAPEALELILGKLPGGVSSAVLDKLMALQVMHETEHFWGQWHVFLWCTMALTGVPPDWHVLQAPTIAQCYASTYIADRVRTDLKYSDEVEAFLGVVHRHDEVLVPQAHLDFVEVRLDGEPPVNLEQVRARWPEVLAGKSDPTEQTPEDEQLRRMREIAVLLEALHREAAAQLKEVLG